MSAAATIAPASAVVAGRRNERPRVLLISRKWPPAVGGMENYSRELAHELAGLCDFDRLVLPGRPGSHRPPSMLRLARFLLAALGRLAVEGRHFDAVVLGDMALFPLAAWLRIVAPRTRVAVTAHGTDVAYGLRRGWKPALYRLYLRGVGLLQACADVAIANSQATAGHCRRIGFSNVVVVPLAVRVPESEIVEPVEDYVLFVGRVDRRKGAGWFAGEVMPLLPERVRFKVAGPIWDERERAAVDRCGRADFVGCVFGDELVQLRRRAIAVVVPNVPVGGHDFEGFGLCATEAAGDGGIVVAAALDGIVDAVRDGETGFLLPPEDAAAWAAQIREIIGWDDTRREAFVAQAQATTRQVYSWDRVARDTLAATLATGEPVAVRMVGNACLRA